MRPDWFPDWSGQTCAIVAGGSSVTQADVDTLRGRCRVLVVNNAYQLAPWADALYAADERWWGTYRSAIDFAGLKMTCHVVNSSIPKSVRRVQLCNECEEKEPRYSEIIVGEDVIGRGGNSAFQALNLAVVFGAKTVFLLGFDFCGSHWHEPHPEPLKRTRDSTRLKWRDMLDAQSKRLQEMGITVLNCSSVSLLQNYRKVLLQDVLPKLAA